ncbi:MAG: glycosyltransferase family 4 protein [Candidatus Odinarchaeota archaeon]
MSNILFLCDVLPPAYGGLATSSYRIIRYLAGLYDIVVLSPRRDILGDRKKVKWPSNVQIFTFKQRKSEARYLEEFTLTGERLCQENEFSLIIGFYLYRAGFIATYLGQRFQIPSLLSARGNDIHRSLFHPDRHAFVSYALNNCSLFTAVSSELIKKAQAFAPTLAERSVVVGNGINFELHAPRTEKMPENTQKRRFVLGFAGDGRKKKGFHVLVQALSLIPPEIHSQLEVKIAGLFDKKELDTIIAPLGKRLPVSYVGCLPRDLMPSFYQSLDLLVVPSVHDGVPNVLLEGIVNSAGVIGSRTGGIAEVLQGFPELMFRPEEPEELAFIIRNVIRGTWNVKKYMEPLREFCRINYSEEAESTKWLKAIGRAIQ